MAGGLWLDNFWCPPAWSPLGFSDTGVELSTFTITQPDIAVSRLPGLLLSSGERATAAVPFDVFELRPLDDPTGTASFSCTSPLPCALVLSHSRSRSCIWRGGSVRCVRLAGLDMFSSSPSLLGCSLMVGGNILYPTSVLLSSRRTTSGLLSASVWGWSWG